MRSRVIYTRPGDKTEIFKRNRAVFATISSSIDLAQIWGISARTEVIAKVAGSPQGCPAIDAAPWPPLFWVTLSHRLRHIRIPGESIAQRVQHGAEPRLKAAPVIDGFARNRTAYLFGTGRQYGALGFVEAQTILLERQLQIVQQPPHFAFRIAD
jgi:hypothetical protein